MIWSPARLDLRAGSQLRVSTLDSIDGVMKVCNVAHAREFIRKHQGEFIELEFADKKMDRVLRVNATSFAAATERSTREELNSVGC